MSASSSVVLGFRAIVTKYHGPTTRRPSRISARIGLNGKPTYIPFDYDMSTERNHMAIAERVVKHAGYSGSLHGAHTKDGMVFVLSKA